MDTNIFFSVLLMLIGILAESKDERAQLKCSACRVVTDEIKYAISKVDPKKLLQVNGFRVDPNGNQKSKQVSYARSETHLTSVMDELCETLKGFAKKRSMQSGVVKFTKTIIRRAADASAATDAIKENRDRVMNTLKDMIKDKKDSLEVDRDLKFMCENLIENYDEELMSYFKQAEQHEDFCSTTISLCDGPAIPEEDDDDDSDDDDALDDEDGDKEDKDDEVDDDVEKDHTTGEKDEL